MILGRFYNITGVSVGVKTTFGKSNPEPNPMDINLKWMKNRPITNQKKFDKAFSGVFIHNIEWGVKFLKTA